ncbi:MAG TPA: hypothetical protein ENI53_01700 [Thermoplasmatales archaeon]|nr:hypothetical protein [Thermoplasmatales archaeon]
MKKKIVSLFMVALFLIPISLVNAEKDKATVEIFDFRGNKIMEKEVSYEKAKEIEKEILNGDFGMLGIKFDFGFSNYLISYGRGKVYIPFSKERCFLRFMLRPIFFNYEKGFTIVKFGANYLWKGKSLGDYGMMFRSQCGMMLGFYGLHIKISWKLRPDTHIFVGGNLLLVGKDKIL